MSAPPAPLLRFKDLCIDATDAETLGAFWGRALGLEVGGVDDGEVRLSGSTPQHTIWVDEVPEPRTVKQRVHLDVRAEVEDLVAAGAEVVDAESFDWVVLRDPEGGELCAFPPKAGAPALMEVGVDTSADPNGLTRWWADALGAAHRADEEHGWHWVQDIADAPFGCIVFAQVPEPKTVKNRIHLDFTGVPGAVQELVRRGATILREPDGDDVRWHVLADPEGNEFCVFEQAA